MKLSKKILSIFLSIVTVVTMLAVGTTSAFAAGWVSRATPINLGTVYNESADYTDTYFNDYYYDAFVFSVPAKGKVKVRIEAEDETYMYDADMYVYRSSNLDDPIGDDSLSYVNDGYSSGGGYYYREYTANLSSAGTYYLEVEYDCGYVHTLDEHFDGSYDIRVTYTPSFSNTSLSKVSAKKKAFNAKWKKCSNVSGYQLQYSTKKNMKSAKTYTFKGNKTTSKTVSKLKKKKTYYVRVRTYKTVKINGKNKTYYGKWSSKKAVKTK